MAKIAGKRILVTGGAGFIGSNLCDALLAAGAEKVACLDNFFLGKMENIAEAMKDERFVLYRDDARQFGVVQSILEKEKTEVVFNMATIALNYSFFNPFDAYLDNVQIANTLLELMKVGAFQTLIHTSSSEAYGTAQYSPMDENHPTNPTTPYAAGKAAADLMVHSFYKVLGLDISIVRPFNNYGPRQNAEGVQEACEKLTADLEAAGISVKYDDSDRSPGWKFADQEMRGFPMRIELGPKDLEAGQCVLVRRDTREKTVVPLEKAAEASAELLGTIQKDMLERARAFRDSHTYEAFDYETFKKTLDEKPGFVKAFWCEDVSCEDQIKADTTATSRCMPFDEQEIPEGAKCVCCGKPAKKMVYWGKAY